MLVRVVKMTFSDNHIQNFAEFSATIHKTITGFDGCHFLEILQDVNKPEIFFTHSHWESEAHLDAYRQSDFFKTTWQKTKQWFDAKPEAWSLPRT